MRVYELAKELNTSSKRLIELFRLVGVQPENHMSRLRDDDVKKLLEFLGLQIEGESGEIVKAPTEKITDKGKPTENNYDEILKIKLKNQDGTDGSRKLQYVYNSIEDSRKRYGDYKKCEFHIHTPASKCYRLISNWTNEEYENSTLHAIIDICKERHLYSDASMEAFLNNISYFESDQYVKELKKSKKPYESLKEYLSYKLIAQALYVNEIKLAIITDHNTISGYEKLKYAINEYFLENRSIYKHEISIILGIEISCSDLNHVIGMFKVEERNTVERFLIDIKYPGSEGTFYPSQFILEEIFKLGGFAYLAHFNSSEFIGNDAYKSKLYNNDNMIAIGLSDIEKKEQAINRIKPFLRHKTRQFCFINESDSHSIDDIGKRNTWIKFSNKINFINLIKAIEDYGVCIRTDAPSTSDKYIKGIVISPGIDGYLRAKENQRKEVHQDDKDDLIIEFSHDLNCIIGGRGTGKSTLINIINTCFNLESEDRLLRFISKNNQIFIVFHFGNKDYILRFVPQVYEYYNNGDVKFSYSAFTSKYYDDDGLRKLSTDWVELYSITDTDEKLVRIIKKEDDYRLLNEFFRRGYSINSLVNQISNGTLGRFIQDVVMNGLDYTHTKQYINRINSLKSKDIVKYVKETLPEILVALEKQKETVNNVIEGFNSKYSKQMKIVYSPKENSNDFLVDILDFIARERNKHVLRTYITWNDIENYIGNISEKIGFFNFLYALLNDKFDNLESILSIKSLVDYSSVSVAKIESGLEDINAKNINRVYTAIANKLKEQPELISESILKWIKEADDFTIEFNVNHKESVEATPVLFRPIENLSLGQKVAALLTFVFNYGDFANDRTPLIIDQPEDNLDNQYIFKNLIKSLRDIKNKRQVIVVTHSSTIVTNADAEQVIVMSSDNKNGWMQTSGYPSDVTIIKHIINHMEGGIESFRNKILKYRHFIDELKS